MDFFEITEKIEGLLRRFIQKTEGLFADVAGEKRRACVRGEFRFFVAHFGIQANSLLLRSRLAKIYL
jgi:hypothetical protein